MSNPMPKSYCVGIKDFEINPTWLKFIRFCQSLDCGEIDKLKVLNGVPVLAQKIMQNTKFN
jgi:hypothetical protein